MRHIKSFKLLFGAVLGVVALLACAGAMASGAASRPVTVTGTVTGTITKDMVRGFVLRTSSDGTYTVQPRWKQSFLVATGDRVRVYGLKQARVLWAGNVRVLESAPQAPEEVKPLPPQKALQLTLTSDKVLYQQGEIVSFNLTLSNTDDTPKSLVFNSGQNFDITATPVGETTPVWQWSHDKMFTQALRPMTLAPGETKSWDVKWDQADNEGNTIAAGQYTVRARLATMEEITSEPLVITIGN